MRTILSILVLALGCTNDQPGGGDDTPGGTDARTGGPNVNQSGSRIKMNVLSTPDGAKAFTGWRDTQLDTDCNFAVAADGATRCLPSSDTFQIAGAAYFVDAACTVPAALRGVCAGTEPTHILRYPDCSTPGLRVFRVGAKHTTGYLKSGVSCIALAPSPTSSYYAVGAEVAPATFQSATATVE